MSIRVLRISILLLVYFNPIQGITQNVSPHNLIGIWQVENRSTAISDTIYSFQDTINLLIYHPNEEEVLPVHFTIDRVNNDNILSIIDVNVEKISQGFRTYKLIISNKDKITLEPYTFIFFNEKSVKVEERDASHQPEIHLNRIKS